MLADSGIGKPVTKTYTRTVKGKTITSQKYTYSFELPAVKIELNDLAETCGGCRFMVGSHEMKCLLLNLPLPSKVKGNFHYLGRHVECPLIKVPERAYDERSQYGTPHPDDGRLEFSVEFPMGRWIERGEDDL